MAVFLVKGWVPHGYTFYVFIFYVFTGCNFLKLKKCGYHIVQHHRFRELLFSTSEVFHTELLTFPWEPGVVNVCRVCARLYRDEDLHQPAPQNFLQQWESPLLLTQRNTLSACLLHQCLLDSFVKGWCAGAPVTRPWPPFTELSVQPAREFSRFIRIWEYRILSRHSLIFQPLTQKLCLLSACFVSRIGYALNFYIKEIFINLSWINEFPY